VVEERCSGKGVSNGTEKKGGVHHCLAQRWNHLANVQVERNSVCTGLESFGLRCRGKKLAHVREFLAMGQRETVERLGENGGAQLCLARGNRWRGWEKMVARSCASRGNCLTDGEKLLHPVSDGMCPKIMSRETLPRLARHGKSFERTLLRTHA
jgi:hypothetical protein